MSTDPLADLVGHAQAIIAIANDASEAAGTIARRHHGFERLTNRDLQQLNTVLIDRLYWLHTDYHTPTNRPEYKATVLEVAHGVYTTLLRIPRTQDIKPAMVPGNWPHCGEGCTHLIEGRRRANHDAYVQCLINADTLANTPPDNTPAPDGRYSITDVTWTVTPPTGDRPGYLTGHLHGVCDIHHNIDETEFAAAGWRYIQALAWAINYNLGFYIGGPQ